MSLGVFSESLCERLDSIGREGWEGEEREERDGWEGREGVWGDIGRVASSNCGFCKTGCKFVVSIFMFSFILFCYFEFMYTFGLLLFLFFFLIFLNACFDLEVYTSYSCYSSNSWKENQELMRANILVLFWFYCCFNLTTTSVV